MDTYNADDARPDDEHVEHDDGDGEDEHDRIHVDGEQKDDLMYEDGVDEALKIDVGVSD